MAVLVVNAGSSSLKLRLLDGDAVTASADLSPDDDAAAGKFIKSCLTPAAIGHRIVHGGTLFRAPALIDPQVRRQLDALTDLAPLHQPTSLAAVDLVSGLLPHVPAVACFDTAFHATIPDEAATYALPREWRRRWTLRKYGFHGLSHAYVSRRVASLADGPVRRVVSCHLGSGASLCAVLEGRSVDTTMGFTPLDGLVMGTRSGSVDPGLLLWLEEHAHVPPAEVADALEHRSGLYGLAGTADMRQVLAQAASGSPAAVLAREVYLHRLRGLIAAMAAALGGLDALAFTGGVGENSADIRAGAAAGLDFLGVHVDDERNAGPPDREISAAGAPVRSFVIAAREDLEIARQVRGLLALKSRCLIAAVFAALDGWVAWVPRVPGAQVGDHGPGEPGRNPRQTRPGHRLRGGTSSGSCSGPRTRPGRR